MVGQILDNAKDLATLELRTAGPCRPGVRRRAVDRRFLLLVVGGRYPPGDRACRRPVSLVVPGATRHHGPHLDELMTAIVDFADELDDLSDNS